MLYFQMLAPTHCHLAKRYKGPALLCVLAGKSLRYLVGIYLQSSKQGFGSL